MNKSKMTVQEFCEKLDYEGIEYGFTEYGMSHTILERSDNPEFYDLVKTITEKYTDLRSDINSLESYMNDYIEEL